jgi:hypothetical protein
MPYCAVADVEDFLGVSFTTAQEVQAARVIEAVTLLIDKDLGFGFSAGAQTGEKHYLEEYSGGILYLIYIPVSAVAQIRGRAGLNASELILTVDVDYEVISLSEGKIRLVNPQAYDRVSVDYIPVDAVPAPIRDACAEWAAARMMPSLRPDTYGLDSYSLPDITVKFSRSMMGDGMPSSVKQTLDHYRNWARS